MMEMTQDFLMWPQRKAFGSTRPFKFVSHLYRLLISSQLLDIIGPTPHMTHFPLLKKISVVVEASIVAPYRETKTT